MNCVHMEIPFVLLSFRMNREGELEKRFLTPFGLIDILFRKIQGSDPAVNAYDIEVEGDTDSWISVEPVALDFRKALMRFIVGIVEKDMETHRGPLKFHRLVVRIQGSETNLTIPAASGGCYERELRFSGRP